MCYDCSMRKKSQDSTRDRRRKSGLCIECESPRIESSKSYCEKHWKDIQDRRQKNREHGICEDCSQECAPSRRRCQDCLDGATKREKAYIRKRRKKVIEHYGGKCACCGESQYEFMTIDHINNDGAEHRRSVVGTRSICLWLIKHNFPPEFQILCWNCNAAKQFHGICPHHHQKTENST